MRGGKGSRFPYTGLPTESGPGSPAPVAPEGTLPIPGQRLFSVFNTISVVYRDRRVPTPPKDPAL